MRLEAIESAIAAGQAPDLADAAALCRRIHELERRLGERSLELANARGRMLELEGETAAILDWLGRPPGADRPFTAEIRAVVLELVTARPTDGPAKEEAARRWARIAVRHRARAEDLELERDEARQELEETAQERDAITVRLGEVIAWLERFPHDDQCPDADTGATSGACACGLGQVRDRLIHALDGAGRGLRVAAVALAAETLIASLDKHAPAWRCEILQQGTATISPEIASDEVVADWRDLMLALGQDPSGIH